MHNNQIVYRAKLHWILFLWPCVLFSVSIFLFLNYPIVYILALFFGGFAIAWFILTWLTYKFSALTIKKRQVILSHGILMRQTIDIPLNKIESIDIRQSLLGSILQYGSLIITGTGGTRQFVNYLQKPLTCRRHIEQLTHGVADS